MTPELEIILAEGAGMEPGYSSDKVCFLVFSVSVSSDKVCFLILILVLAVIRFAF